MRDATTIILSLVQTALKFLYTSLIRFRGSLLAQYLLAVPGDDPAYDITGQRTVACCVRHRGEIDSGEVELSPFRRHERHLSGGIEEPFSSPALESCPAITGYRPRSYPDDHVTAAWLRR